MPVEKDRFERHEELMRHSFLLGQARDQVASTSLGPQARASFSHVLALGIGRHGGDLVQSPQNL